MKIQNQNCNTHFTQLITTSTAEKLLKKADRAVKATNAEYLDINIPDGHRRPLWSVLSGYVKERQALNKNNIIIDTVEDKNGMLSVKTCDSKGFKHKEWTVNPYPVTGSLNEVVGSDTVICGKVNNTIIYGKSDFFDVIDSAEFDADYLSELDKAVTPKIKTSIKLLPKDKEKVAEKQQKKKESLYMKIIPHVQRPFLVIKQLLLNSETRSKVVKIESKKTEKLPRKMKKVYKKGLSQKDL